ncbi:MAG: UDP-N-acetylmuramate--L-alanine ligase [Clostridia bacterium]|nr:UDP-N-acetylmuramate--L-alanine ligase [Clostridia bacterium]
MKTLDIFSLKHIFFIGIGGISQSALATICLSEGIKISGSDKEKNDITEHLKLLGVNIFIGHNAKNVLGCDLVVYSGAINLDNEEILQAKKLNIPTLERGEFLGLLSKSYKHVIAVGGVHGKTTTTGMLATIFSCANLNPTVHIGGEIKNFDSNVKIGGKDYFITEACEYRDSFLHLNPHTSVILNIEHDHPDYYKNLSQTLKSFDNFAKNGKNLVIGESYKSLVSNKKMLTFSLSGNSDFVARNIKKGYCLTTFSVFKKGEFWSNVSIRTYGEHNVYNALCAICVSDFYNIDKKYIVKGLSEFGGVKRRFDFWGKKQNALIFHDYAHHPTEIATTIKSCKEHFNLPIICFFQPHTYSRTKYLFGEFLSAFNLADYTFILPTYPSREKSFQGYSGSFLAKNLKIKNQNVKYLKKFESIPKNIKNFCSNDCVILILGAGDIFKVKNII